jgi:hypothetical protein
MYYRETVLQFGYLLELYEDAQSEKILNIAMTLAELAHKSYSCVQTMG